MNYIYDNEKEKNKMLERFCRYVKIWSESDSKAADQGVFPSSQCQWDFARTLEKEIKDLGVKDVSLNENCYLIAKIPSNIEESDKKSNPTILLMAHMDTVDEVTGKNVNPQVIKEGQDTIVKSDGSTLLGADDKAGVTAIMSTLAYLLDHKEIKHSPIEIMFSPDEETGHGMDKVPLEKLNADFAITVDGGDLGELESECFNAFAAKVKFTGKACHTGNAKAEGMINAVTLASNFTARLPHEKSPECSQDYQGFIAPMEVTGSIESSEIQLLLRAFTMEEIEEEKKIIQDKANEVVKEFGGMVDIQFTQQYLNMKDKLDQNPEVMERLRKAFKACDVEIKEVPIRGGTDGSRLTEMGIPTPNIFTGAHEFHSRKEWLSLNQMAKAADILLNIVTK
ncbi:MAG: tripeptide aminopeptidase PepT [Treponema sp.]|nr:tripeptide aminopeptidase PepT [Treponema sp.]